MILNRATAHCVLSIHLRGFSLLFTKTNYLDNLNYKLLSIKLFYVHLYTIFVRSIKFIYIIIRRFPLLH